MSSLGLETAETETTCSGPEFAPQNPCGGHNSRGSDTVFGLLGYQTHKLHRHAWRHTHKIIYFSKEHLV